MNGSNRSFGGQSRRVRGGRRGAVLVAALVCLAIIVAMVGSMLLAALATGRQLHVERDLRQCELLLQAGVDRAAYRSATERGYRGEIWMLPADQIVGADEGKVTIEALPDSPPESRRVSVFAEYPTGSEKSIRRSHTISLPSKPSASEE